MPGPRRSQGCYRCRSKKVKCDEERPECRRCQRNGLQCPGYRPENEILFLDMNQRIENKALVGRDKQRVSRPQPRSPSFALRPCDTPSAPNETSKPQVLLDAVDENSWAIVKNPKGPMLYKSMSTDWQERALCRFFADYVVQTDDLKVSPGFLHNLPRLFNQTNINNSVLRQSVTAVALSSFANQVGSEDLLITARKCYGRSLVEMHRALSERRLESDETLAGCLLLTMYEMFTGDKPQKFSVWESHGDALRMLLRARGTVSQFTDPACGGITRGAHRVITIKNIVRRTTPGLESQLWEKSMDKELPWSQAHLALNRIAHLLPIADEALREEPSSSEKLLHAIDLLQAEDRKFQTWSFQHGTASTPEDFSEGFESDKSPRGSFVNGTWNEYRAGRIFLLQTLRSLADVAVLHEDLAYVSEEMQKLQIYTSADISAMVNDISVSTAFVVVDLQGGGRAERKSQDRKPIFAYNSVFPLRVALSVRTLSPEQRDYISGQVQSIEKALGLKLAGTKS